MQEEQSNGQRMQKVNRNPEAWIPAALAARQADGTLRTLRTQPDTRSRYDADGRTWLNFASNDYLDLAHDPRLLHAAQEAAQTYGVGATASRLVTGNLPLHEALEAQLAQHRGYPAALLFGSGFLTNAGVVPALVGRSDHVFIDRLAHASMIDATRLSGAHNHRFAHNDAQALRVLLQKHARGRRLVLTESVFSMDGDIAPLKDLVDVAAEYDALVLIDEAHAGGVFGPAGGGLVQALHLTDRVHCAMGTCSKALGSYGGYVACSATMRTWLINQARSVIYTTALPPGVAAASLAALQILTEEPDRGSVLLKRAQHFRQRLQAVGANTLQSASQIVPVLTGDNTKTMRVAERLRADGIIVGAIRPPTVPPGKARLRFSLTYGHSKADLDYAAECVANALEKEGVQ